MPRLRKQQIDERFEVEQHHTLVRHVTLSDGSTYDHRCPLASFKQIAHAVEEAGAEGTTIEQIADQEDLPTTQVAVARAFLFERGNVEPAPRRRFRMTEAATFEDAIIELYALAES